MSYIFKPGQRWYSEMEPELGLGTVFSVNGSRIILNFEKSQIKRHYAALNAPLQRVKFESGDWILTREGKKYQVEQVAERDALLFYYSQGEWIGEDQLSDLLAANDPNKRLLSGQIDPNHFFNLRLETHFLKHQHRKSPLRGLIGARVDLIPHQFYLVNEIVHRHLTRLLLADEVGLGKTIEASLIIHNLLITRKISRVLILVPQSLQLQWFSEMFHRFNQVFRLIDEKYCRVVEKNAPQGNPFLDSELAICCLEYLQSTPKRRQQAAESGWDLIVVDEAHHLIEDSPVYTMLKTLAAKTERLLLLTATPTQLGEKNHFKRLQLLDPDRYFDYQSFINEEKNYLKTSQIARKIMADKKLSGREIKIISQMNINQPEKLLQENKLLLLQELLDRHGIGRVMFRNTRLNIHGFPGRFVHLIALEPPVEPAACLSSITAECRQDWGTEKCSLTYDYEHDPRVQWLIDLLTQNKKEKFLLICSHQAKVNALQKVLKSKTSLNFTLFHEEIDLKQRDKNAIWFKSPEGAQLLISSEIGSEGRNFQFVQSLILFDLPLDPELIEQRIGRLDRIGQTNAIFIYIPYIQNSALQVMARWYHEGLNLFEKNLSGASQIMQPFRARLIEIALNFADDPLSGREQFQILIQEAMQYKTKIIKKLKQGHDFLLEMHSYQPHKAGQIIECLEKIDASEELENYLQTVFDFVGIRSKVIGPRTYHLLPGVLKTDAFPRIQQDGLSITFERKIAVLREDVAFINQDHPLVENAFDLILGTDQGTTAYAVRLDPSEEEKILLETVFVVECVAQSGLNSDRFLPPTPLRVVIDHELTVCTKDYPIEKLSQDLKEESSYYLLQQQNFKNQLLPRMVSASLKTAENSKNDLITRARKRAVTELHKELQRLIYLQKINPNVGQKEIQAVEKEIKLMEQALNEARLRFDAMRIIYQIPLSTLS